ncbi:hypothetical protein H2203_004379 [Taxawa tesnikishii (nom. ined.)]|nr:hypothetical protein H2203_004379 [Dothideales sp. JES 119]
MSTEKNPEDWQSIAKAKREALFNSIPSEWRIPQEKLPSEDQLDVTSFPKQSGMLSEKELEITSLPAQEILRRLHDRTWTSEEVTTAFCKRAAIAHQLTNCLSETLFDSAISTARTLDQHLERTGKPIGSLHGLPISLKDNFNIAGLDSTIGFASWVNAPAQKNSALVDLLTTAGAVLYVKTNVPTAMMIAETVNNFRRRERPHRFPRQPLGVGTDIGGSLRIPAACTGIFTLRPSFGRFPTGGAKSGLAGQEAVNSVNGPMARTLADLELFGKAVVGAQPWRFDPKCVPVPWRSVEDAVGPKLNLGVMWDDGMVVPTPPVARALREAVSKLRDAGHEIVEWPPTLHKEIAEVLGAFFVADGGKSVEKIIKPVGEPWRPEMEAYAQARELGVHELWQLQGKRTQLMKDYLDRWTQAGIDGIICPATPFATVEHGKFKHVAYTGVFNVLDYAATSFPTGMHVDKALDKKADVKPLSDTDAQIQAEYNAEAVHGMPISLQLVASRLEEEKVLAMTKIVLQAL